MTKALQETPPTTSDGYATLVERDGDYNPAWGSVRRPEPRGVHQGNCGKVLVPLATRMLASENAAKQGIRVDITHRGQWSSESAAEQTTVPPCISHLGRGQHENRDESAFVDRPGHC